MTIKQNTVANYIGITYTTLAGVVMLPLYMQYLGAEAYGLIGFYTLMMSWLGLMVSGITPTILHQVAYYHGKQETASRHFRELFRSFEMIVVVMAIVTGVLIWILSPWLAGKWLSVRLIPAEEVVDCIRVMGAIIALRWISLPYINFFNGIEKQVWLNGFNIAIATMRYVVAIILLKWLSQDPYHYFGFQLVVSLTELAILIVKYYRDSGRFDAHLQPIWGISWSSLKGVMPFSLGAFYTALLWVLMTQTDKLVLSHVLPLEEYGYLSLIIVITGGILQVSSPVSQAVVPRMTALFARQDNQAFRAVYQKMTQYISVSVLSVTAVVAAFPGPLLLALTGNQIAADWGREALTWFALGNGLMVISGLQYILQYVSGNLRMHVMNTTISAAIQLPVMIFVAMNYNIAAVAKTWFVVRLLSFLILPSIVHRKFMPGMHAKWLSRDVVIPALSIFLLVALCSYLLPVEFVMGRGQTMMVLGLVGVLALFCGALAAPEVRGEMLRIAKLSYGR